MNSSKGPRAVQFYSGADCEGNVKRVSLAMPLGQVADNAGKIARKLAGIELVRPKLNDSSEAWYDFHARRPLAGELRIEILEHCFRGCSVDSRCTRSALRFRHATADLRHVVHRVHAVQVIPLSLWLGTSKAVVDWSLVALAPRMTREPCCIDAHGAGAQFARCDCLRPFNAHRALVLWYPA